LLISGNFLDLHVYKDPCMCVVGLESLEEAVATFLHMSFKAEFEYDWAFDSRLNLAKIEQELF
jgi:hypothetical protein